MEGYQKHPGTLYAVAVISNFARFESRYNLYRKFARHMEESGAVLITVECAFGDRNFAVTETGNPHHVRLRSFDEIWLKESMINIGFQRVVQMYPEAKYLAWIDADIEFQRKDWVNETLHRLEHNNFVQLFQTAIDLGPTGEAFQMHQGFLYSYVMGKPKPKKGYPYAHWHPGFAWACRREALDMVGGLYDVSVLGSGDHLMAWALIGEGAVQLPPTMARGYVESLEIWEKRAELYVHRDVGFVPGTILHHWHGKKKDRRYRDRWEILADAKFDPEFDLRRDAQGLLALNLDGSRRMNKFRDDLRNYFSSRNEDSIDTE